MAERVQGSELFKKTVVFSFHEKHFDQVPGLFDWVLANSKHNVAPSQAKAFLNSLQRVEDLEYLHNPLLYTSEQRVAFGFNPDSREIQVRVWHNLSHYAGFKSDEAVRGAISSHLGFLKGLKAFLEEKGIRASEEHRG